MNKILKKLVNEKAPMDLNPPAAKQAIKQFEQQQGGAFPAYYREFLLFGNGGHLFGPSGPDFYGIDANDKHYSVTRANAKSARDGMPDEYYVIGATSFGDLFCIDFGKKEVIQWDHETRKVSNRWPTVFECIEYEFDMYKELAEEDEEKEDNNTAVDDGLGIKDLFYTNDYGLFVAFDKGIFADQMIFIYGWEEDGLFQISVGSAQQISPFSRDAIPDYDDWKILRDIPLKEQLLLYRIMEAFCEANPGKIKL